MKYPGWVSWLGKGVWRHFLAGVLVIVPIGATILILVWIFNAIDNILQPIIRLIFDRTIPGVGFGITIILIYFIGVFASNVGGRKLINFGESVVGRVPLVRTVYTGIKQILESFSSPSETRFMQAVFIEFPRKGIWTMGFITNESVTQSGETQLNVFIPTSPNPMSGFLQITGEDEVLRTDISVDEALKMIVSAGRILPKRMSDELKRKTGAKKKVSLKED